MSTAAVSLPSHEIKDKNTPPNHPPPTNDMSSYEEDSEDELFIDAGSDTDSELQEMESEKLPLNKTPEELLENGVADLSSPESVARTIACLLTAVQNVCYVFFLVSFL